MTSKSIYRSRRGILIDANGEGKREANGKKIFWSRGKAGLRLVLWFIKELPKNIPRAVFYLRQYKEIVARLAERSSRTAWRASLPIPILIRRRSSGTGFHTYAWRGHQQ